MMDDHDKRVIANFLDWAFATYQQSLATAVWQDDKTGWVFKPSGFDDETLIEEFITGKAPEGEQPA